MCWIFMKVGLTFIFALHRVPLQMNWLCENECCGHNITAQRHASVTCLLDDKKWSFRSTRGSQWMGKGGINLHWNSLFKFRDINIWCTGSLLWKDGVITEFTIRVRTEQFLRSWEQAWCGELRVELEIWSALALLKLISSLYSSSTWVKLLSHHHKYVVAIMFRS